MSLRKLIANKRILVFERDHYLEELTAARERIAALEAQLADEISKNRSREDSFVDAIIRAASVRAAPNGLVDRRTGPQLPDNITEIGDADDPDGTRYIDKEFEARVQSRAADFIAAAELSGREYPIEARELLISKIRENPDEYGL